MGVAKKKDVVVVGPAKNDEPTAKVKPKPKRKRDTPQKEVAEAELVETDEDEDSEDEVETDEDEDSEDEVETDDDEDVKDEDDADVKPDTSTVPKPKKKKPKVPLKTKEQLMEEARQLEKKLRSDGTSVKIDAQGRTAIKALQQFYNEKKKTAKSALFPEVDYALHLMAVFKKASRTPTSSVSSKLKIHLPFALQSAETSTVCLIVRDLRMTEKDYNDADVDKQAREWKEKLMREQNITATQISKILTRRQMEREYHTYADKRNLASAYDLFLVDSTITQVVNTMCGKEFQKAHKFPVIVNTERPLEPQIKKAFRITLMPSFKLKNRVSFQFGHLGQPLNELAQNMNECIVQLRLNCPGGSDNIQSIYLQPTSSNPSLPIYADLGARGKIRVETPKQYKERMMKERKQKKLAGDPDLLEPTIEDVSTLPDGYKVAVYPDGEVRVLKDGKEVRYPLSDDEHEERDGLLPAKKPRKSAKAIAETRKFHREKQRAAWNALNKAKEKAVVDSKMTVDEKDAKTFRFKPLTKNKEMKGNGLASVLVESDEDGEPLINGRHKRTRINKQIAQDTAGGGFMQQALLNGKTTADKKDTRPSKIKPLRKVEENKKKSSSGLTVNCIDMGQVAATEPKPFTKNMRKRIKRNAKLRAQKAAVKGVLEKTAPVVAAAVARSPEKKRKAA